MATLDGYRIVELGGIGPAPFAAMMLADHGAAIIRIARRRDDPERDPLLRGRGYLELDLKSTAGRDAAIDLIHHADAVIEGFRPGVAERLGLGPDAMLKRNPRLVYGRITGWGQTGPWAGRAGHDLNYIALSGVLAAIGDAGEPTVPLNLIGDFGGGGMLLAFGMLAGLLRAAKTGEGQVIDAAMTDGAALLMAMTTGLKAQGLWPGGRGENLLDGGAPFYGVYPTRDGKFVAVGALEPQFQAALFEKTGLAGDPCCAHPYDRATWPGMRMALAAAFATKSRDQWAAIFAGDEDCVTPVLDLADAANHPHNQARGLYGGRNGQPMPAPRFSQTPALSPRPGWPASEAELAHWKAKP